jgi:hypothetical protein
MGKRKNTSKFTQGKKVTCGEVKAPVLLLLSFSFSSCSSVWGSRARMEKDVSAIVLERRTGLWMTNFRVPIDFFEAGFEWRCWDAEQQSLAAPLAVAEAAIAISTCWRVV